MPSGKPTPRNRKYEAFSVFKNLAEYFVPVATKSAFYEKGVLTPEEFVKCGDLLVDRCPTWAWASGSKQLRKEYLPSDKQFLVTKAVPCLKRAKEFYADLNDQQNDADGWTVTELKSSSVEEEEEKIEDIDDEDDDDVVDIDEISDSDEDDDIVEVEENENVLKNRTYDISITYDKYYQTPRVFMVGYGENGKPLAPGDCLDDIHDDYRNKTATIESHPHTKVQCVSIHPCRHGVAMKKMIDSMSASGKYVRVELYLYIFLKFISSTTTANIDYTVSFTK